MSCECFQIGGPFISEDPSCPAHGTLAQAERREREAKDEEKDEKISTMQRQLDAVLKMNLELTERVRELEARFKKLRRTLED
jgi:uncharacterized Zn finger protein (UPF0148 family)